MSPLGSHRRKTLALNIVLAALLATAVVFAYTSLGTSTSSAATTTRTGTVAKGTVLTTVSATGTLISPSDLGLDFVTTGTLRALYVKVGDKVTTGQVLAKVDATSAKESVTTAKNALASALASRTELLQGQTAAQKTSSAIQLQQSAASVTTAEASVTTTEQNNAADVTAQAAAVAKAQTAVTTATTSLATAKAGTDQTKISQASNTLTQAKAALVTAQQQQVSTALKDAQSLSQAHEQVASAQLSYKATVAQQAETAAPPTASQLVQARSAVDSATIQLASAERALAGTTLRAAAAGTVASIASMVGSSVSSSASSSTTTATTTGTAVASPAIAGKTATVTAGDSGFLVLTDVSGLQVSASFTEDDAASLKVGQGATITLNALPTAPVSAAIASISSTGTATSGVVSYTVYLDLTNPPATLKVGQSGTIAVITQEADGVLYVPTTAVTTGGGISTVTVISGKTKTRRTVGVGIKGDTDTVITSGLTAGQSVALTTTTTGTTGTTGGALTGGTLTGGGGAGFGAGGPGGGP